MAWQLALAPDGELLSWAAPYVCLCGALLVRADSDVFVSVARCSLATPSVRDHETYFHIPFTFLEIQNHKHQYRLFMYENSVTFLEQFSFDRT